MKKIFALLIIPMGLWGQNWKYDFGTGTDVFNTNNTTSLNFLPQPPSGGGTDRIRVSNAQGGYFSLMNPGLSGLGSGSELKIIAANGSSQNKFSIYDYTPSKFFTLKFKMQVGDSTGGDTATSGDIYLFVGDSVSFSNNAACHSAHSFCGFRFRMLSGGGVQFRYRAGGTYTALAGSSFSQGTVYNIEIIGNNTTSSISYGRGSVAVQTYDLYVNGTLVGDDLSKDGLPSDANIDSWTFYAKESVANSAAIFLDDIEYANYICGNITTNASTQSSMSEQCTDGDWTVYGTATERFFSINKNGNTLTPTVSITVSSAAVDSSKSSNGANQEHASYLMKRYWNVDCGGCTPTTNGGVSVRFFYDPADSAAARTAMRNAYIALKATNTNTLADTTTSMQWVKNSTGAPYEPSMFTGNKMTVAHLKLTPIYGTLNGVRYVQFDTIKSFSGGGGGFAFGPPSGGGGVGLPVTWAGFDAVVNADHTELLWHTASEQNTSHFEVEASEDGKNFMTISENIAAAGNSASLLSYSYSDRDLAPVKYYRLKQVDIEGTFDYSKIIIAKRGQETQQDFEVIAYPLSSSENKQYQLLLKNTTVDLSTIQVLDYTGKPVLKSNTTNRSEILDLSQLTSGIYILSVSNGGERQVVRIAL
jgi:hypothetical protein